MRKNIIITGLPGTGKSTFIKKIISEYPNSTGFTTNEIREDGERTGFEIETSKSEKALLASTHFKTLFKVSKYYVAIDELNRIIPCVAHFKNSDLLYLDEIGQMQLFSISFINDLVLKYFAAPNTTIMTLSKVFEDPIITMIKERRDIILIEVTKENREEMLIYTKELLGKIAKAKRYVQESERFSGKFPEITMTTDHETRHLVFTADWQCDCSFFEKHKICSHIIAVEKYTSIY
ncbi:MAG: nucleoside-triphosphatase [Candidatus Gracilibacteria bacterium]